VVLTNAVSLAFASIALNLLSACSKTESTASHKAIPDNVVNLFMWADEMAPDTLPSFEKLTGIAVNVSYFDSPEMLESRMLTGHSGFDVVMPSDAFVQRYLRSGAYAALDKSKLPNLAHLDPSLMQRVASSDPGNTHTVIYAWGTMGIGYNKAQVAKRLPGIAVDSWNLIFDPALSSKFSQCGISMFDDPVAVVRLALIAMGRSPNKFNQQDLVDAEHMLHRIRPFIRNINTANQIQSLANGDLCVVMSYNGNVVQARKRAQEAGNGIEIEYSIPNEGSLIWFDLLAVPKDAPHPDNAYRLINYLMDPAVTANFSNNTRWANANTDATPLMNSAITADAAIYPPTGEQERLILQSELTLEQIRAITRLWQNFKTGR
jgi:putrescine transport system substrate-binding protein